MEIKLSRLLYEALSDKKFNDEYYRIIKLYSGKIYDSYRKVKPSIDVNDFFIHTEGTFKNVNMSLDEFEKLPFKEVISDSGSRYKIDGTKIYRNADHWGRVASCYWDIDNFGENRRPTGMIDVSELKPNSKFPSTYIKKYPNHKKVIKSALKDWKLLMDKGASQKQEKMVLDQIKKLKDLEKST